VSLNLGLGALAGLIAFAVVAALAAWREFSRRGARRAWFGPAVTASGSSLRAIVRVVLLAIAAGSATASFVGLNGADPAADMAAAADSIVIALEISRSMDAGDVAPSRLAA
jgi:hypothetical protein